ncbi:MAG TPA: hypothetical protein VHQ43_02355 [Solirubrobacterales bacterium]|jgi:hypothetical protein|nr:hypothetical protein [Solirubrobacterales bacterium]
MAKALGDEMRIRILVELNKRPMSVKQFDRKFCGGEEFGRVAHNFKVLRDYDWLEEVGKKSGGRRRGATERFYRATQPAMFDTASWSDLPMSMKRTVTAEAAETYVDQVREALVTGTIDARDDRHFTWTATLLDQRGWDNMIRKVDGVFKFMREEQIQASIRMMKTGEQPIPATVGLAVFESPADSTQAH